MRPFPIFALAMAILWLCPGLQAQHLKRRAFVGVQLAPVTDSLAQANGMGAAKGARVAGVIPNSTAASLKLLRDDIITQVNGIPVEGPADMVAQVRALQAGDRLALTVSREGRSLTLRDKVQEMPRETAEDAQVTYGEAKATHGLVRTILKHPRHAGKHPAVLFLQGYGCQSLDNLPADDAQQRLVDGLVEKGYAVMKVDRPGTGDSEGSGPCAEISYQEEVEAYAAALRSLKQYDFIDSEKVFLFGHSLGGGTAPLIAMGQKVKGVAVYGVAGKPWYEYMMDVYREQRILLGEDPMSVDGEMQDISRLLYAFMIEGRPVEELAEDTRYATLLREGLGYDGNGHIFGRRASLMREIQAAPYAQAWKEADTRVLAIYGEADLASISPANTQLLVNTINLMHPGSATYHFLPGTDHGFIKVGTAQDLMRLQQGPGWDAYAREHFNRELVEVVDGWMRKVLAQS